MSEHGFDTVIDGMTIHTRFPWADFTEKWQDGMVAYVRSEYANAARAGNDVAQVVIDHINVQAQTFQPRIDLRHL